MLSMLLNNEANLIFKDTSVLGPASDKARNRT